MEELKSALRSTFEDAGYDVGDVTVNRDKVRVEIQDDEASASDLRAVVTEVVDEDDMFGLDVTTGTGGNQDTVATVVSFRYRG